MDHRSRPGIRLLRAGTVVSFLAFGAPVAAQDGPTSVRLVGTVVDASSGAPIAGLAIRLSTGTAQARTDDAGRFEMRGISAGVHVLTLTGLGYGTSERTIRAMPPETTLRIEIQPVPIGLEGFTVSVDGTGTLDGRVVEARTGRPVAGISVWIEDDGRGVFADSAGEFRLTDSPFGPKVLRVRGAGYGERLVVHEFFPGRPPVEIALDVDPLIIAGVPAVDLRLRGRRNAFPGIVTVHDTERIVDSGADDVKDYLFKHTLVHVVPCSGQAKSFWCVDVNGKPTEPQVCIDGWLEWGGIDLLQRMDPDQLYLLEVYGTKGLMIRAYTYGYIETLAGAGRSVAALEPTPQRDGVEGLGWASVRSGATGPLGPRC